MYEELGSRLGEREESREITDVFAAGAAALLLAGRSAVRLPLQEGSVRRGLRIALLAATLSAALVAATPAGSANECDGLQVCVPVAGPWVSLPSSGGAARPGVAWQLTCPRGYIVGGLDAELTHRAIDLSFLGMLGSPVNPGITTSRSVTFVGTYVGASSGARSFKPYIGCMPAQGGGSRVPTSVAVFPPGQPVTRRVKTVRVRPGSATVIAGVPCR